MPWMQAALPMPMQPSCILPTMSQPPTPEQQVRFFQNLQYLLAEGEFVSTDKFALLLALGRWAIENPEHDERDPLDVGALAGHFLDLYWPQARPFSAGERTLAVAEVSPTYGRTLPAEWDGYPTTGRRCVGLQGRCIGSRTK